MTDDMATPAPEPPKSDAALSHFGQQVQAVVSALFTMGLVKADAYPPSVAVCVMDALESHHAQPREGERLARDFAVAEREWLEAQYDHALGRHVRRRNATLRCDATRSALLAWHERTKEAERGG